MTEKYEVYDVDCLSQSTYSKNGQVCGKFREVQVSSVYQPIYSLAHKRPVGYEALVRAKDVSSNQAIPPDHLFGQNENLSDIVFIDRLCRYIHMDNFKRFGDGINWLFLNVAPQTIIHGKKYGSYFKELLEKFNIPPHRIVVEIVEYPIASEDNTHLLETIKFYKELGCLTAIDDFGAGHSNFDRIWTLKPDIVKLDRSMLLHAASTVGIRQLLPGIVSLLHQAGALVVIEGIETKAQAAIAMESDADLVQGYFFSKPDHDLHRLSEITPPFDALFDAYREAETLRGQESQYLYARYHKAFLAAVELFKTSNSLAQSSKPLFEDDALIRCYLLRPNGLQIGETVTSPIYEGKTDQRFKPLEDAKSANWFRRHYLRRAIMHPEQLQITRPYLSITGAHMCVTLSMMFRLSQENAILCCDIII